MKADRRVCRDGLLGCAQRDVLDLNGVIRTGHVVEPLDDLTYFERVNVFGPRFDQAVKLQFGQALTGARIKGA